MPSNNDRLACILRALANSDCAPLGVATSDRIESFLGYPYYFDRNLADLVSEGAIVETFETLRSGRTRRLFRLA